MPALLDPFARQSPVALSPMAPNALIIGAMKSSTTLLFDVLGEHPSVFTPDNKEPHFFSGPDVESQGAWERYLGLFAGRRLDQSIVMEASTTYTRWPQNADVAPLIRERLGSPRLIYILRDPVQRAVSHYRHSYARGHYAPGTTFDAAMIQDPILLNTSRYAMQLRRYDEVFGAEATLVALAEDLHDDRAGVIQRVGDHLGLSAFDWAHAPERANSAESVRTSAAWRPLLDRFPFLERAKRRLPSGLRDRIKSLRRPAPEAPLPTEAMLEDARRALAEDMLALETRIGPIVRRWPLMPGATARGHGANGRVRERREARGLEPVGA